jgi:hypothetical protein
MGVAQKKMTADQTVAAFARLPGYGEVPKQNLRCQDHKQTADWTPERNGAWDYICTFGELGNPKSTMVGVRVGPDRIVSMSSPYEAGGGYVRY